MVKEESFSEKEPIGVWRLYVLKNKRIVLVINAP